MMDEATKSEMEAMVRGMMEQMLPEMLAKMGEGGEENMQGEEHSAKGKLAGMIANKGM